MNIHTIKVLLDLGITVASSATNLVNLVSSNRAKQKQLHEEHIANMSSLISRSGEAITDIVASAVSLGQNKDVLLVDSKTKNNDENVVVIAEEAANG